MRPLPFAVALGGWSSLAITCLTCSFCSAAARPPDSPKLALPLSWAWDEPATSRKTAVNIAIEVLFIVWTLTFQSLQCVFLSA